MCEFCLDSQSVVCYDLINRTYATLLLEIKLYGKGV